MLWTFLSCGAFALFGFLAVGAWSDARRREREAYYKNDALKKLSEAQGPETVLTLLREERTAERRKHIEGIRLGGMITAVVGVGMMIFLFQDAPDEKAYWVGLIPLLIGATLLAHSFMVKE